MTTFQMISIAVLALVALAQFGLPQIRVPKKPSTMKQIEAVLSIKESSNNPKVVEACSQLLTALLN